MSIVAQLVALVIASAALLRLAEAPHQRFALRVVLGSALIWLTIQGGHMATVAVAPYTLGFRDPLFAWPEAAIGVRGVDVARLLASIGLEPLFGAVYVTYGLVAFPLSVFAAARRTLVPVLRIVAAFTASLLVGCGIYVLAPAEGPVTYYGLGPDPGWLVITRALRAGLDAPDPARGLICCPSFHTVGAAIVLRELWRTPLRNPAALWSAATVVAAWAYGEHYLTDLVVGAALGLAAHRMSRNVII